MENARSFFIQLYGDAKALWPSKKGVNPVTGEVDDVEETSDCPYDSIQEYWKELRSLCLDAKDMGALELWEKGTIGKYMVENGHFQGEEWSDEEGRLSKHDLDFLNKVIECMETLLDDRKRQRV
jgi:hypothetical protein